MSQSRRDRYMYMGQTVRDLVKERPMSLEDAVKAVEFFAHFTMDLNTDMGFLLEAACLLRAEVKKNS